MVSDKKLAKKYTQLVSSSYDRGLDFDLSLVKLRRVLNAKRCFFTGIALTDETRSIDRVDSSLGYIDSNIVPCHTVFNSIKGQLEDRNTTPELNIQLASKGLLKLVDTLKDM